MLRTCHNLVSPGSPDPDAAARVRAVQARAAAARGDPPAGGDVGLSTSHISPRGKWGADYEPSAGYLRALARRQPKKDQQFRIEVPRNGGVVKVRGFAPDATEVPHGKRGKIGGFSPDARRRLLVRLNSLDRQALPCLPIFVTLTYPGQFSPDPKTWKRDLDVFLKRLQRQYPDATGFWKLEPQKRGAPHYHLLVFGVAFIDKDWTSSAWYDVVGSGDVRHLEAGTRVERVHSWNGVNAYAAKYLGKTEALENFPEFVGRWWGMFGRDRLLKFMVVHEEVLSTPEFVHIRRALVRYLRRRGIRMRASHTAGVTVFINSEVGFRLLDYYRGPPG